MIAFAFIGLDGLPIGGGIRPQLPDGAIPLTAPFTTADLPRLRWTGSDWVLRDDLAPVILTAEEQAAQVAHVLARARAEAVAQVNARVDQARRRYLTDIAGQEAIYAAKRAEALAYLREAEMTGEPAALDDYPLLAAEVGLTADTPWQLAQVWLHLSDAARAALAETERQRQVALQRIAAAPDLDAIEAVLFSPLSSERTP